MTDFTSLGLPAPLLQALARLNFTSPTPIQAQAVPLALQGRDVLGSAQTGTGKTGAFGIPLVARLLDSPGSAALVLTPTRELATQVLKQLRDFLGTSSPVKTALLIGGEAMPKQLAQLRARPRLIVGTPGRINDHLTRHSLKLNGTDFLVLDETDRMLDMGFGIQIEKIIKHLHPQRQTLMFSATMPANIVKMAEKYLQNPERIAVGSTTEAAPKIRQELIHTPEAEKYTHLLTQLESRDGSVIIFVKTKYGTERLAQKLTRDNHSADIIHGDLRQRQRDRVIQDFRNRKHRILVATDVAARGLDIPHIEHVINYDLPQCPEDYIHRIGRTARAGAEGSAVCLITPTDQAKWRAIHKLMHPHEPLPRGMAHAAKPKGRPFAASGKTWARPHERKPRHEERRDEEKRGDDRRGYHGKRHDAGHQAKDGAKAAYRPHGKKDFSEESRAHDKRGASAKHEATAYKSVSVTSGTEKPHSRPQWKKAPAEGRKASADEGRFERKRGYQGKREEAGHSFGHTRKGPEKTEARPHWKKSRDEAPREERRHAPKKQDADFKGKPKANHKTGPKTHARPEDRNHRGQKPYRGRPAKTAR